MHLQDLRVADIRDLKTRLPQSLQPGTTRKILGLIHHALQSAVEQELLATNPASAESAELLRVANDTPYDMPIRFALATGAR